MQQPGRIPQTKKSPRSPRIFYRRKLLRENLILVLILKIRRMTTTMDLIKWTSS